MKTVLLLVHEDPGQEARLQAALDITRALEGHLKCVDVTPLPLFVGDYDGGAQGLILMEERRAESTNRVALETRLAHEEASWDWIDSIGDMASCVLREAGLADLIVVNSKRDTFLAIDPRGVSSTLAADARCPIMAVPDNVRGLDVNGPVVIAWDGSEPVMATLRASAPLLKLASSVHLFSVEDGSRGPEAVPAEAAAVYLSRHDIHAGVHRVKALGHTPDALILEECAARGARYCLMGAFGHGRMREELFGGVTRRMLDAAQLPLLLGH
jgi:nucleotide-binding universal stress UspA family protein